jgi:hypothetical protein
MLATECNRPTGDPVQCGSAGIRPTRPVRLSMRSMIASRPHAAVSSSGEVAVPVR